MRWMRMPRSMASIVIGLGLTGTCTIASADAPTSADWFRQQPVQPVTDTAPGKREEMPAGILASRLLPRAAIRTGRAPAKRDSSQRFPRRCSS